MVVSKARLLIGGLLIFFGEVFFRLFFVEGIFKAFFWGDIFYAFFLGSILKVFFVEGIFKVLRVFFPREDFFRFFVGQACTGWNSCAATLRGAGILNTLYLRVGEGTFFLQILHGKCAWSPIHLQLFKVIAVVLSGSAFVCPRFLWRFASFIPH